MLASLVIEESESTPKVVFDPSNDTFEISGNSFPNDANEFYDQVLHWFEQYTNQPKDATHFKFHLDYFNSSSAKLLLELLKLLMKLQTDGKAINISWYYLEEDEDMLYAGEEFSKLSKIPFKFVCLED